MAEDYYPLNCPETNECEPGICICIEKTGIDYRVCPIFLDKTRTRIKLNELKGILSN